MVRFGRRSGFEAAVYDHVLIILAQMRSKTSSCSGEMPSSPWLTIPLEDYEAHMALPVVGQAQMLAEQLVLQLAHAQQHAISPSDYRTLNALSGAFRLVVPADLVHWRRPRGSSLSIQAA
jgi:hypothetical protein